MSGKLIKVLIVACVSLVLAVVLLGGGYIFLYSPYRVMAEVSTPVHAKWQDLAGQGLSQEAAKGFAEMDKQADALGFKPAIIFSIASRTHNEHRLYLSPDSRTALFASYIDRGELGIVYVMSFVTYFKDGAQLYTTNYPSTPFVGIPEWMKMHNFTAASDAAELFKNHSKFLDDMTKTGLKPMLLEPGQVSTVATQFEDKAAKWRADHGYYKLDKTGQAYSPTYHMALQSVLYGLQNRR
jgi:hypothetical protein